MVWLLVLLTSLVAFSISSVVLAARRHARSVTLPFFATWAVGMTTLSLFGLDVSLRDRTLIEGAFDSFYGSLWLASALIGAATVTRRFQPGRDMLNTIFGAIAAGFVGIVVGTIVLAFVSCARGLGCV